MTMQPLEHSARSQLFRLDKKNPLRFTWASLFFIYILQYPLTQLLPGAMPSAQYHLGDWMRAYGFVVLSIAIFMPALILGMSGKPITINSKMNFLVKQRKPMWMPLVIMVFGLFCLWSYIMVNLKIGMTIYTDFDPLPYRITGFLFYGRLFVQPVVLAFIAYNYADSKMKWLIVLLLIALGSWVSLASGSRYIAIMFALPILVLLKGKSRALVFSSLVLSLITIATLARSYYLPYLLGDEFISRFCNSDHLESLNENLVLTPIAYIIERSMGMSHVLLTLSYGDLTHGFTESLKSSVAYFLRNQSLVSTASIKQIYGVAEDYPMGFGLDVFSNFWVTFGGHPLLYVLGLLLVGWMLGKTYRLFAIGLARLGMTRYAVLVFIMLFIILFENRAYLFPAFMLMGWICSSDTALRFMGRAKT